MKAVARVVAEADGRGGTRLTGLRSEAPLVLRATAEAVYLVGGAAGPLGGDDLSIEVDVGPGAHLTLRSAAASVALPGPGPSRVRVRARVGTGGRLHWLPEPVVAAEGCDHRVETTVELCSGGGLTWREEIMLGRYREDPGSLSTRLMVDIDGRPLLRHELALGPRHPHASGPAVVGTARAVGSVLLVGPARREHGPTACVRDPRSAVLALDGPAVQVVALADDAVALRQALDAGCREVADRHRDARRVFGP